MAIETKTYRYFSPSDRDPTAIIRHVRSLTGQGVDIRKVSGPFKVDGTDWGQFYYRIEYNDD